MHKKTQKRRKTGTGYSVLEHEEGNKCQTDNHTKDGGGRGLLRRSQKTKGEEKSSVFSQASQGKKGSRIKLLFVRGREKERPPYLGEGKQEKGEGAHQNLTPPYYQQSRQVAQPNSGENKEEKTSESLSFGLRGKKPHRKENQVATKKKAPPRCIASRKAPEKKTREKQRLVPFHPVQPGRRYPRDAQLPIPTDEGEKKVTGIAK